MFAMILLQSAALTMPLPHDAREAAIEKGLRRLETAATSYVSNRSCFSCHHQAVPLIAFGAAPAAGFTIDKKVIDAQADHTTKFFADKLKTLREGAGLGGGITTAVYAALALKVADRPRNQTTDALVEYLLKKQQKDGSWPATNNRPPSQGSVFTNGALAIDALSHYGDSDDDDQIDRVEQAKKRGLKRLLDTKPTSTEDRVFLLWALVAGRGEVEEIAVAREHLLKQQRANGGWSQLDGMGTDAYATGTALTVLQMAGLSADNAAFKRGARYLIATQLDSGGWIVNTRSRPVQTYFDNGDPGGKSQFISTAATGWAVRALLAAK